MEQKLYDITEICRMFGITSRTLRFYEEKGIIQSTTVLPSARRHYTEAQMENIRNVLVLRSLGLPLRTIVELQGEKGSLKEAVLHRRGEIFASLETKAQQINLLEEALASIHDGVDIFQDLPTATLRENRRQREQIASECTRAFVEGRTEILHTHLSEKMQAYMPESAYVAVRTDALAPVGEFVSYGALYQNRRMPNVFIHELHYQLLSLRLEYVLHKNKICGYWIRYIEESEQ